MQLALALMGEKGKDFPCLGLGTRSTITKAALIPKLIGFGSCFMMDASVMGKWNSERKGRWREAKRRETRGSLELC